MERPHWMKLHDRATKMYGRGAGLEWIYTWLESGPGVRVEMERKLASLEDGAFE